MTLIDPNRSSTIEDRDFCQQHITILSYVKEGVENQSTINNASSESEQELSTIYDSMVTWSKSSKLKGAGTSRYNYFYRGSYQAMDPLAHFDQQLGLIISTSVSSHLLRRDNKNKPLPPLERPGECEACNCDNNEYSILMTTIFLSSPTMKPTVT